MKPTKHIMALIAIFFFSGILNAGTPKILSREERANNIIAKISRDITLTDSQKTAIVAKSVVYEAKVDEANTITNRVDLVLRKKQISEEFDTALDSILSADQREELKSKQEERRNAIISKHLTNNNQK